MTMLSSDDIEQAAREFTDRISKERLLDVADNVAVCELSGLFEGFEAGAVWASLKAQQAFNLEYRGRVALEEVVQKQAGLIEDLQRLVDELSGRLARWQRPLKSARPAKKRSRTLSSSSDG